MIKLPRLFNKNGTFSRILNPVNVSLTINMKPLSSASMEIMRGESIPLRSYVELFYPYGSAGMFRVRMPQEAYGDGNTIVELEHMISEVGDYLVKEEISEMMAADAAMKRLFKHYKGTNWKLGSVAALGTGKVSVSINYDNVLNSMLTILDQKQDCMLSYDFSKKPWVVSVVKKPTAVTAECRLSRNVTQAKITYDDSEMCTRVYYELLKKDKNGDIKSTWKYIDAPTISTYGVIERTVNTTSDMTDSEVVTAARTFLREHQQPRVCVRIEGVELSDLTGESLDKFTIGKLLRLAIPEDGINVEKNIHSLNWANVYGDPRRVTVQIGDEEDTVVTFLHNLDASGSSSGRRGGGGGGGGKSQKEKAEAFKKYETGFLKSDEQIELFAREMKDINSVIKQAGMSLDRNGVLIYSRNSRTSLQGLIDVQSNRIDLVVKGYGKDATVDAANIVAGINKRTGSFIKLSAKQIELSGYVTMGKFSALEAAIENLKTGKTTASILRASSAYLSQISCSDLSITNRLSIHGHNATFKNVVVGDVTYHLLGY